MSIPNKLTVGRFFLAVVFLALLWFGLESRNAIALYTGFVIFVVACMTDLLDGYLARKYNTTSAFGRVADPFVDKILICCAFIFFIPDTILKERTGFSEWMVALIVAREFLVTGLRGFVESKGIPFGATYLGKTKMVVQAITVGSIIVFLTSLSETTWAIVYVTIMVWATVVATVASGAAYVRVILAHRMLEADAPEADED